MNSRLKTWIGLSILLLLTYGAYSPGLSGGFLFDDFVNLNALGATGPIDNWQTFFRYITSGTADPTGRPIAMLSFLLDARDWPADPSNFLRTNLIIHLTNGLMLFYLIRELGRWLGDQHDVATRVALLAAGIWLLHPLFVSTTLYIVQREAMLPATMMLIGLLTYLHGRRAFDKAANLASLAWMALGIFGGTFLAVLCKGNGILLPLLALILEYVVIQPNARPHAENASARLLHRLILVVPTICIFAYLLSFLPIINQDLSYREWTIGDRLLTQPRAIAEYLFLLFVPRSVSSGVYNDSYVLSTSLMQPAATLPAIFLVVVLPTAAWLLRRKLPSLSAAILFFFAGHLLESSVVPLELYFEHRNYLPALLLFWPVSRALLSSSNNSMLRNVAAVSIIAVVSLTTYHRSVLWGQPYVLAQLWASKSPNSSRAQATIAMMDRSSGRPDLALARLAPIWQQRPNDLQIAFNYIDAACALRGLAANEIRALAFSLEHSNSGLSLIHGWLGNAIEASTEKQCGGLDINAVESWLRAAQRNPVIAGDKSSKQDVEPLWGRLEIAKGNPESALKHFNQAFDAFPTPSVAARQAAILASHGYYKQALAHLDRYEIRKATLRRPGIGMPLLHERVLSAQGYWPNEMRVLRQKLASAIAERTKLQTSEAPPP